MSVYLSGSAHFPLPGGGPAVYWDADTGRNQPDGQYAVTVPETDAVSFAFKARVGADPMYCCLQLYDTDGSLMVGCPGPVRIHFAAREDVEKSVTFNSFHDDRCLFDVWLEGADGVSGGLAEVEFSVYI